METKHTVDFLWYTMAVAIALIAVLSDSLKISGTVSEPMLWSLFGVAISRIMTNRELKSVQRNLSIQSSKNKIQPSVETIIRKDNDLTEN